MLRHESDHRVTRIAVAATLALALSIAGSAGAQQLIAPKDCPGVLQQRPDATGEPAWVCVVKRSDTAQPRTWVPNVPAPRVLPELPTERRWYGAPMIVTDAVSVLTFAAGVGTQSKALSLVGGFGFVLGGMTVHAANGRWAMVAASYGLRAWTMVAFGYLGRAIDPPSKGDLQADSYPTNGTVAGLGLGMVAASVIDVTFFTHKQVKKNWAVQWAPTLATSPQATQLGVQGVF